MIDNITEYAINKKLFGGGGGKREGTAIDPKGTAAIYLNTSNTIEETDALLSQLTYVQTDLLQYPVYIVYSHSGFGSMANPLTMFIVDMTDRYSIYCTENPTSGEAMCIYDSGDPSSQNGWVSCLVTSPISSISFPCIPAVVGVLSVGNTDLFGIPVGTENEKIKNVLSATRF